MHVNFCPYYPYSSTCPPVYFDTMTQGSNQVRRLSTINSLKEPTFIHTTEWVWYWEDELGKWRLYASAVSKYFHWVPWFIAWLWLTSRLFRHTQNKTNFRPIKCCLLRHRLNSPILNFVVSFVFYKAAIISIF